MTSGVRARARLFFRVGSGTGCAFSYWSKRRLFCFGSTRGSTFGESRNLPLNPIELLHATKGKLGLVGLIMLHQLVVYHAMGLSLADLSPEKILLPIRQTKISQIIFYPF